MNAYAFNGKIVSEQPLATCSKTLADTVASGQPLPVPSTMTAKGSRLMFPATGIRGALRRAASDVLLDMERQRTGKEKPLRIDQHYLLRLGGVKDEGSVDKSSVTAEPVWRKKNVLLSLFGAGAAGELGFVSGHLAVGNAICSDPVDPITFSGARTDDFYRDQQQVTYLTEEDVETLVAKATANRGRSAAKSEIARLKTLLGKAERKAIKTGNRDEADALRAELNKTEERFSKAKEVSGAVSVGMPLAGFQAIPQGHDLAHRMFLYRADEVELGCLLAALHRFALWPFVGAHYAVGCGLISATWDVTKVDGKGKSVPLGPVSINPLEGISFENAEFKTALDAFEKWGETAMDLSIPTIKTA